MVHLMLSKLYAWKKDLGRGSLAKSKRKLVMGNSRTNKKGEKIKFTGFFFFKRQFCQIQN